MSGIILGQLAIGFIADRIGRKWGSVMNAAIMFVCECPACRAAPPAVLPRLLCCPAYRAAPPLPAGRGPGASVLNAGSSPPGAGQALYAFAAILLPSLPRGAPCRPPSRHPSLPAVGILMAASSGSDAGDIFAMFTACQFLFGVGVGGEYPVASTSANERAENTKHLQKRRGETVVVSQNCGGCRSVRRLGSAQPGQASWLVGLCRAGRTVVPPRHCRPAPVPLPPGAPPAAQCVFSMQGWGNLFNTMVLIILMAAFDQYGPTYRWGRRRAAAAHRPGSKQSAGLCTRAPLSPISHPRHTLAAATTA